MTSQPQTGIAILNEETQVITLTTSTGEVEMPYDGRPAEYLAETLALHGWTPDPAYQALHKAEMLAVAQARREWTPTNPAPTVHRCMVISHPAPDGWRDTLDRWTREHGHLPVQVRGLSDPRRVRYLVYRPGDTMEYHALCLEIEDPNGQLFARAGLASNRKRAARACNLAKGPTTLAEAINPDLIPIPAQPEPALTWADLKEQA